ncbi:hypothetical protein [Marinobacter similis]|uniref:Uncharacterized protein n=1 Tax=Marinobacter similis TaxID=1420916 RepID=W5YUU2_9GAMM|nr:hypothetical protein [Marinobacter similis]AHI30268.1 hypothetical protein AU14_17490 [Marinobacter similis]
MFRYAAVNAQGEFLEVKGQDLFLFSEDAEKAMGKTKGYDVRPVPVGMPLVVAKRKEAPAVVARKRAVVKDPKVAEVVADVTPEAPTE